MIRQITVLAQASKVDSALLASYCRALTVELGVALNVQTPSTDDEAAAAIGADGESGIVVLADDLQAQTSLLRAASRTANVVFVDLESAVRPRPPEVVGSGMYTIRGRGLEGLRWAARTVVARASMPWITESYGELPDQKGDLRVPPMPAGERAPIVVLIHGGAWRERWERDLMDSLAVDLTRRGYATWNIEYRRVGSSGGGWPTTFEDVGRAIDAVATLAEKHPIDPERTAFVGHSAGGHLALWAASRGSLPVEAPGASPAVAPSAVVSLAGVLDLAEMGRRGNEEGATMLFMGGLPDEVPDRYALGSPAERLPLGGCPQLIAYGGADRIDLVDNNRRYCALARAAGDSVDVLELPGADHFHVIDPRSTAWIAIAASFTQLFPAAAREHESAVLV